MVFWLGFSASGLAPYHLFSNQQSKQSFKSSRHFTPLISLPLASCLIRQKPEFPETLDLHPSPVVTMLSPGHSGLRSSTAGLVHLGFPLFGVLFPHPLSTLPIPSAPSSQCLFPPEVFSDHSIYLLFFD